MRNSVVIYGKYGDNCCVEVRIIDDLPQSRNFINVIQFNMSPVYIPNMDIHTIIVHVCEEMFPLIIKEYPGVFTFSKAILTTNFIRVSKKRLLVSISVFLFICFFVFSLYRILLHLLSILLCLKNKDSFNTGDYIFHISRVYFFTAKIRHRCEDYVRDFISQTFIPSLIISDTILCSLPDLVLL